MKKEAEPLSQAIGLLAAIFGILFAGCIWLKLNTQVVLLICTLLLAVYARIKGHSLDTIEGMAVDGIRKVAMAFIINICIGMLIGIWVAAGTVSFFIRLCIKLIQPEFFLVETFLFCCVFSALMGSCWICAGTVGVVLFSLSQAVGIHGGLVLGAIVGGSRFGACISPISESATVSKILSGAPDIYRHIRSALRIVLPAAAATAVIYLIMDLTGGAARVGLLDMDLLTQSFDQAFRGGVLTLIPAAVLILFIYLKMDTITCLLSSIIAGVLVSAFYQGLSFASITDILFRGYGAYLPAQDGMLTQLFARGGMTSMTNTLFTLIVGMCMSGILNGLNVLQSLIGTLSKKMRSPWQIVFASMLLSIAGYGVTGDSQPAKVLVSSAFAGPYDENGLDRAVLSRNLEMSAFGEGMFPWTVGAVYFAAQFGVSVTQFWYLIFFYYFVMLFNILDVLIGARRKKAACRA